MVSRLFVTADDAAAAAADELALDVMFCAALVEAEESVAPPPLSVVCCVFVTTCSVVVSVYVSSGNDVKSTCAAEDAFTPASKVSQSLTSSDIPLPLNGLTPVKTFPPVKIPLSDK